MKIIGTKKKNTFEITEEKFYGNVFYTLIRLPDKKKFIRNRFFFLASFSNIEYILKNFPKVEWDEETFLKKEEYINFKKQEEKNKKNKTQEVFESYFNFKTKPFAHQLKAFEISKDLKEYALLFEQGCGKTKVIIDNANYLFNKGKINCLIVIAPNGVHRNWIEEEIPIHINCKYSASFWKSKMNKKEKEKWNEIKIEGGEFYNTIKIFTFNVECFISKKARDEIVNLLRQFNCLLCIDESQRIKNHSAKRTKYIIEISKFVKYKRICTGTPITKGVQDIYTQFKFLNPNIIGISNYYAFRARYCIMGGYEMKQIVGYKYIEELQNKIQSYSMRVLKKECLDLPDKIYQRVPFDITKTQRDLYEEVKKEGIATITEKKELLFNHVITRIIKMQQIISGYIFDTDRKEFIDIVEFKKNPKILKLKELLDKISGKVIVWSRFSRDIDLILKLVGNQGVRYDGKISSEQRKINKDCFKKNKDVKYFISNLQVGSTGLTLTEAETAIYYSNSYDLELRLQSEDRCHRIGTKNNINYIDLEANKTIDKKIIKILRNKKRISDMILQDPISLFLEE